MRQIEALPNGAADTAVIPWEPPVGYNGWPGRNGARCFAAQIGLRSELERLNRQRENSIDTPYAGTTTSVRAKKDEVGESTLPMLPTKHLHSERFV